MSATRPSMQDQITPNTGFGLMIIANEMKQISVCDCH